MTDQDKHATFQLIPGGRGTDERASPQSESPVFLIADQGDEIEQPTLSYPETNPYEPLPADERAHYMLPDPDEDQADHFRFLRQWQDAGWARWMEPF